MKKLALLIFIISQIACNDDRSLKPGDVKAAFGKMYIATDSAITVVDGKTGLIISVIKR